MVNHHLGTAKDTRIVEVCRLDEYSARQTWCLGQQVRAAFRQNSRVTGVSGRCGGMVWLTLGDKARSGMP
jgi:hypothetical protein